ncbi:MAG: lipoate--protein ligase family protein [Candidatus Omnitrophica bacterium]|nr:lipoate--protein ligase family protein [Candidatus Omnitrophota bacterium]
MNLSALPWRIICDGFHNASRNMAFDEVLFRRALHGHQQQPVLRLYGFHPQAVTVGACQKMKQTHPLIDYSHASSNVTRRITGGGVVFHDNNLTYSIVAHKKAHKTFLSLKESYRIIHSVIQEALHTKGLATDFFDSNESIFMGTRDCFTTPVKNDLMIEGKKIAGGAQKRSHDFLLHQGSISLEPLLPKDENYYAVFENMCEIFIQSFYSVLGVTGQRHSFTQEEIEEASVLEHEKYIREEWILKN